MISIFGSYDTSTIFFFKFSNFFFFGHEILDLVSLLIILLRGNWIPFDVPFFGYQIWMLNGFIRISDLSDVSFRATWTLQELDFHSDSHSNFFLNSILSGKEFLSMGTNLFWISCLDIFSNLFPIFPMLIKTYLMSWLLSRKIFFSSSVQRPTFLFFSEFRYSS